MRAVDLFGSFEVRAIRTPEADRKFVQGWITDVEAHLQVSKGGKRATRGKGEASTTELIEPLAASKQVQLFGRDDRPIVNGKRKKKLTKARYDVILALIKAGDSGLSKDELVKEGKHGDPLGILRRLAESDRDWKQVISFAKQTGRGYRIK